AELRKSGRLLELGQRIKCPVVAIHGDYDPHPVEGVHEPLAAALENFRLILLKNCGHRPWNERLARDEFFMALREELARWAGTNRIGGRRAFRLGTLIWLAKHRICHSPVLPHAYTGVTLGP